ncbi:hypothetical protein M8C21_001498, partial [Ambrosia artemisiifolia]
VQAPDKCGHHMKVLGVKFYAIVEDGTRKMKNKIIFKVCQRKHSAILGEPELGNQSTRGYRYDWCTKMKNKGYGIRCSHGDDDSPFRVICRDHLNDTPEPYNACPKWFCTTDGTYDDAKYMQVDIEDTLDPLSKIVEPSEASWQIAAICEL